MGLDFLAYLYLSLSFSLAMVSAVYPNFFLGCYLFLYSLLMMKGEKVNLILASVSSFRIFLLGFLLIFIILQRKHLQIKNLKKIFTLQAKQQNIFLVGIFSSILIPTIFHYFFWGQIPRVYLLNSLKALFPLIFLLYPRQLWDFSKINKSLIWACLGIFLITTIPSIGYYLQYGLTGERGLFRIRQFSAEDLAYTKHFFVNQQLIPIFHLTEAATLIWSVLAVPLFFAALKIFTGETKVPAVFKWLRWIPLTYLTGIIYINQMFKMMMAEMITIATFSTLFLTSIRTMIKSKIKIFIQVLVFIIIVIFVTITRNDHWVNNQSLREKFKTEAVDITLEHNIYETRSPIMLFTLLKTFHHAPLKGFGYPLTTEQTEVLPSGAATISQSTNHMVGIDMLFYFGLILGWLASFLFIAPLLFILWNIKKWFKYDPTLSIQFLTMSLIAVLFRFLAELGRDIELNAILLFFILMLINFDKNSSINGQIST